ncbi:MAG: RNA polymerase sigma factor, partial [Isosphaeraceae bacterium]
MQYLIVGSALGATAQAVARVKGRSRMGSIRRIVGGGVAHHLERLFNEGSLSGLSEGQLLDRFHASRDESAFEVLVERHGPMVLGVCRQFLRDSHDVDDAFQATFLVLVRKAGSLRRKELLGNWLYGVATRVALRARALRVRRQSRMVLDADIDARAGNGRTDAGQAGPAAVLQADERPILLEEVNRLPQKYREPIVLCSFEGLTHNQAAARLGWPVGTVKGRLSRARDLLRTRLSRRGVTVSSAALLAFASSADLRAAVPFSLTQSTVKAALAILARGGLALTASSAVSLSVTSLTEGVIHTMVLSQLKSLAFPALVASGLLTTGTLTLAYQRGGAQRPASEPTPATKPAAATKPFLAGKSAAGAPEAAGPKPFSLKADIQAALKTLANLEKSYLSGEEGVLVDPAQYYNWSLNLMEAQRLEARNDQERRMAVAGHRNRIGTLLAGLKGLSDEGKVPESATLLLARYLQQAERLEKAEEARSPEAPPSLAAPRGAGGMAAMSGTMMKGMTRGTSTVQPPWPASQPPAESNRGQPAEGSDIGGFGGGGEAPDEALDYILI